MPTSLRIIKQCSENNILYKDMHIADLLSLLCSIDIDLIKRYLNARAKQKMNKKGIASVKKANANDFDSL